MAWKLRALAALSKYPCSIPNTHMVTQNCNSSDWGPNTFSWPTWTLPTCGAQTFLQSKHPYT